MANTYVVNARCDVRDLELLYQFWIQHGNVRPNSISHMINMSINLLAETIIKDFDLKRVDTSDAYMIVRKLAKSKASHRNLVEQMQIEAEQQNGIRDAPYEMARELQEQMLETQKRDDAHKMLLEKAMERMNDDDE